MPLPHLKKIPEHWQPIRSTKINLKDIYFSLKGVEKMLYDDNIEFYIETSNPNVIMLYFKDMGEYCEIDIKTKKLTSYLSCY